MLGLRATRAARLPCPYPSPCSAAQAASLSGPARRAPPLAVSLLASARPVSSAWSSAMRPSGELPRPGTRGVMAEMGADGGHGGGNHPLRWTSPMYMDVMYGM
ncbi:hypothetical protein ZWY2020_029103 [Hordeum vulgare]|nr:hypothetical protein ZWY2020_029103 [Hordeum vulgare]